MKEDKKIIAEILCIHPYNNPENAVIYGVETKKAMYLKNIKRLRYNGNFPGCIIADTDKSGESTILIYNKKINKNKAENIIDDIYKLFNEMERYAPFAIDVLL